MKKLFVLLLALTLLFTLASCADKNGNTDTQSTTAAGAEHAPSEASGGVVIYVTDTQGNTVLDEQGNPVTEIGIELLTGDVDEGWY